MHSKAVIVVSNIITLNETQPRAAAVLCVNGIIQALGTRSSLQMLEPKAEVINLPYRWLTPGLTDAHIHLVGYGFLLENVQLEGTQSVSQAINRIHVHMQKTTPGTWITGYGFDRNVWGLESYPLASWLDQITSSHPIAISSRDGHGLWVNSLALQIANIHASTPNPDGGLIVRNEHGQPSGMLLEKATELVQRIIPSPPFESIVNAARTAANDLSIRGLTAVHTMALEPALHLRAILELQARNELPLRIWACLPHAHLEAVEALGLRGNTTPHGENVKIAGIKFFMDGSLGSRTALMFEPYNGFPLETGVIVDSPKAILERGRWALEMGFSPVVHAIGDRANHEVLNIFEQLKPLADAQKIRLRLEHAQHLHPKDIARFSALGVVASVQAIHVPGDAMSVERLLGKKRAATTYAFRSLIAAGTVLALGSDACVATPDPVLGFQAATERCDLAEKPWYKHQALTRTETLEGYTKNAAIAANWDSWYGQISPGYASDFTIWDSDPTQNTAKPIQALRI